MGDDEATPKPPVKPPPSSGSHKKPGSQTSIINRLLTSADKDKDRDERITGKTIEALQSTNKMLIRVIIALILVLGVLVSGVVGVSVSGKVPGYGDIEFSPGKEKGQKGAKAKTRAKAKTAANYPAE